jgi:hypothetical protein
MYIILQREYQIFSPLIVNIQINSAAHCARKYHLKLSASGERETVFNGQATWEGNDKYLLQNNPQYFCPLDTPVYT